MNFKFTFYLKYFLTDFNFSRICLLYYNNKGSDKDRCFSIFMYNYLLSLKHLLTFIKICIL